MMTIACLFTLTACNGDDTTSTSTGDGGTGGELSTSSSGGSTSEGGFASSSGAAGGTGSSGGSGGVGGTGGAGGCTDPLLAYDPAGKYSNPIGPYTDEYGGFFASYAEPFKVDTTCQSVVIGLATFGTFCLIPEKVRIAAWSEPEDSPTVVPETTECAVADATELGFEDTSVHALKFALPTDFKAGAYPFVALQLQINVCSAGVLPRCTTRRDFRYRPFAPGAGWAPLDQAHPEAPEQIPNVAEQLVIGFADCTPTAL